MIRPRSGDFFYSDDEFAVMRDDIHYAAEAGADGVVLGLLTCDGDVDVQRTRELVALAHPMEVTFHRAIDMTRDIEQAIEAIATTGATRILTSGAAQSAVLGTARTAGLVRAAGGRLRVMVAGKVRSNNVQQLAQATGAREFHAALRTAIPSPMTHRNKSLHLGAPGSDEYARYVVLARDVRKLRRAMDALVEVDAKTGASDSSEVKLPVQA
jgi:copper homeostasis protein